jgi:hypothetical protein
MNHFGPYDVRALNFNAVFPFGKKTNYENMNKDFVTLYNKCQIHSSKLINRPINKSRNLMKTSRTSSEIKDTDKTVYPKCNMKK